MGSYGYGDNAYFESPQKRHLSGKNNQRSEGVGFAPVKNDCPQRGHFHLRSFESTKKRIEKDTRIWTTSRVAGSTPGRMSAKMTSAGPNSRRPKTSQSDRRYLYLLQASWYSVGPLMWGIKACRMLSHYQHTISSRPILGNDSDSQQDA